MMISVLKARMAEEACVSEGQADIDDRGSDAGDCMCMETSASACACACHNLISGTEALRVSDNEATCACACHEFLYDECDEGSGTSLGAVQ